MGNMRHKSGQMSIVYYCISYLSVGRVSEWKYTRWNSISNKQDKSINYLDRHDIRCDTDEAVGAFRMDVSGNNIRFRYRCNKTLNTGNHQRHYIFGTSKEATYSVIRGWKMHTKYVNQWCTFMCDSFQDIKFDIYYQSLRSYAQ